MVMSERSRSVLYRELSDLVDDEEAVGEMLASMPRDVDELATKDFVRAEIAGVRTEIAEVRAEIHAATNRIIVWNIGWTFTLAGLVLAAVRFA